VANEWWTTVTSTELRQGDLIQGCLVPVVPGDWKPVPGSTSELDVQEQKLIIITQSCDLEQSKAPFVATCPVASYEEFNDAHKGFDKKKWEQIRQGKFTYLHLLASTDNALDNLKCLIVDFREIFSLPISYVTEQAGRESNRNRLNSPYLEHMAQAFARFFMRVGLPSDIPKYD